MEKHLSTDVLVDVPTTLVLRDHPSTATSGTYLNSSQDDDTVTTLLSAGSYGVYTTDEEEDNDEEFERFNESREEKLLILMRRHARRDRMLDRISRIKSPTLIKLIRRREYAVRQAKYELLFLQHLYDERLGIDATLQEDEFSTQARELETTVSSFKVYYSQSAEVDACSYEDSTIWYDAPSQPLMDTLDTKIDDKKGFIFGLYDYAVMEWHTTMPAIFSLTIHSLAHAALYDGVEILSEEFKKHLEALSKTTKLYMNPTALGHCIMFFFGLVLLRASGQLYWWLNNNDFHCIKFDYHNRLQLGHWDARFLKWMKGHPVLRAVLYFIGYQFCFMVVNDIFDYGFYFLDQRDQILQHLPSTQFENTARCVNPRTLLIPSSCQDEMERMDEEMNSILSEDFEYLYRVVDFKSFEAYFYDWAKVLVDDADEGDVPYPLLSPSRSMLFCFVIAATSVFLLQVYGFGVFSKY